MHINACFLYIRLSFEHINHHSVNSGSTTDTRVCQVPELCSAMPGQHSQGTGRATSCCLQHLGKNHGGGHVATALQLLDRANVNTTLSAHNFFGVAHAPLTGRPGGEEPHPVQVRLHGFEAIVQISNPPAHLVQQALGSQGSPGDFRGFVIPVRKYSISN